MAGASPNRRTIKEPGVNGQHKQLERKQWFVVLINGFAYRIT